MWIVKRTAPRRPYTFIVMAILIGIMGGLAIVTTPTDIFPYINIPMVGVIWTYQGMSPDDMARRVLFVSEPGSDDHRQQYRAHRGDGLQRCGLDSCLHAARYQRRSGGCAGNRGVPDVASHFCRTGIFPPPLCRPTRLAFPYFSWG